MVQFHDPRAEVGVQIDPYTLSVDIARSNRARVACLANGFPDSARFLEKIQEVLNEQHPNVEVVQFDKGNASIAAPEAMLAEIEGMDAAIAAYGH